MSNLSILQKISHAIPGMIAYWDRDLQCQFASKTYRDWFGKSEEEMLVIGLAGLLGPELFSKNWPYIAGAFAGETQAFERVLTKHDGSQAVTWAQYVPDLVDGEVQGIVVFISDISQYVRMEKQLQEARESQLRSSIAQEKAELANQMKSKFVASISHEIRTPIAVIKGYAQLLRDRLQLDAEPQAWLATIMRSSQHMEELIGGVLDLAKIEAGHIVVSRQACPLPQIIEEVYELLSVRASHQGIWLNFRSRGLIPRVIETDALRFKQILINVIGNACKFTREGGVDVEFSLDLGQAPSAAAKLIVHIKDTGIGIAPEKSTSLFTEFEQLDQTIAGRFGGTGLGLHLSKKLALLLGGDVDLETSNLGVGSTFRLSIAVGQCLGQFECEILSVRAVGDGLEANNLSSTPLHSVAIDSKKRLQGKSILIVDDAFDVLKLLEHILQGEGAKVVLSDSPFQALALAELGHFDLVIADVYMPKLSGWEFAALLRKQGYHRPLLAATALATLPEIKQCFDSGFSDILPKPFHAQIFLEKIHAALAISP